MPTAILFRDWEASRCYLCDLSLLHPMSLVSPGKEFVHIYGTFVFVATMQWTPFDCLVLMASVAYVHKLHRSVPNRETILNRLSPHPQGTVERQQT